jgi:hypothetical protein
MAVAPVGTVVYDTSTVAGTAFTDSWVSDLHDTNRYVKFDTSSMASSDITLLYNDIYIGNDHPGISNMNNKEIQISVTPGGYETFSTEGLSTTLTFVGSGYDENVYLAQNDANRITVSGNDTGRIFNIQDGTTTVNNLTLTSGHAPNSLYTTDTEAGGAVYNAAIAVFNNAVIKDSNAVDATADGNGGLGGGIYSNGTSLTLNYSTVKDNTATASDNDGKVLSGLGGGIFIDGSGGDLIINQSLITGNETVGAANASSTDNKQYAQGGGVYFYGDDLYVYNSTISANNNDASMVQPYTSGDTTYTLSSFTLSLSALSLHA